MNKNATPTIIRGVTLVPGSTVYFVHGGLRVMRTTTESCMEPSVDKRTVIGTNGTSFAFVRGGRYSYSKSAMHGQFHYVEAPDGYLVSQAEVDEATARIKDDNLTYLAEMVTYNREEAAQRLTWADELEARIERLRGAVPA
jgi:hypothetical protein